MFAEAGTVALLSLIAPCAEERRKLRERHVDDGLPFVEVFVNTPIEICEQRDPKGLYARARAGGIADFTGIGSGYEAPRHAEMELTPSSGELFDQALQVVNLLDEIRSTR